MFDLKNLQKNDEEQPIVVGDVFGYKNRLFMKIVFRAILNTPYAKKMQPVLMT